MSALPSLAKLLPLLKTNQTATYLDISAAVVMIFDYCLTLGREVEYIWGRPWSPVTTLFLITRYLPFIDLSMTLIHHFTPHASPHLCHVIYNLEGWCFTFGLLLADGILIVRTLAIWGNDRRILWLLMGLLVLHIPFMFYFANRFLSSARFETNPLPPNILSGCFVIGSENVLFVCYAVLLSYETIIFTLTMAKAAYARHLDSRHRFQASTLYKAVHRDGLLFYVYLLAASVVNIGFQAGGSGLVITYVTSMHRAIHAVLAERLLLNIRGAAAKPTSAQIGTHATIIPNSNIEFVRRKPKGGAHPDALQLGEESIPLDYIEHMGVGSESESDGRNGTMGTFGSRSAGEDESEGKGISSDTRTRTTVSAGTRSTFSETHAMEYQ